MDRNSIYDYAAPHPSPAYALSSFTPVIRADPDLLKSIANANKTVVETLTVPTRDGRAWTVKAGQIFRVSTPEGAQVGDLNVWAWGGDGVKGKERFWASRTRQLHGTHLGRGDRLWSNLPYLRPLATIVDDSLWLWKEMYEFNAASNGIRRGVHDLLGTRCDPYVNKLLANADFDRHCHSNLMRAIAPFGLKEEDVHDVINLFQVTGLDERGRYFMEPSPATSDPPSYIDFLAETDLLCALSTCPGGDLSHFGWGASNEEDEAMEKTCCPLKVEVLAMDTLPEGWQESKRADYRGNHGM